MDEMIRYIFGSLHCSETTLRMMSKTLKNQRSFNRSVTFWAMIVTAHAIIRELEIRGMQYQIEALKSEIKEFKKMEGD